MREPSRETEKYKDLKKEVERRRARLHELHETLKDYADSLFFSIPALRDKDFWEIQLAAARGDEENLEKLSSMRLQLNRLEEEVPEIMKKLMEKITEEQVQLKELEDMTEAEWWNIPRGAGEA